MADVCNRDELHDCEAQPHLVRAALHRWRRVHNEIELRDLDLRVLEGDLERLDLVVEARDAARRLGKLQRVLAPVGLDNRAQIVGHSLQLAATALLEVEQLCRTHVVVTSQSQLLEFLGIGSHLLCHLRHVATRAALTQPLVLLNQACHLQAESLLLDRVLVAQIGQVLAMGLAHVFGESRNLSVDEGDERRVLQSHLFHCGL